jgi:2-polyprenyl-3-methyl-5-hydroxy-6-metoxy-1,4-benzoquinol methylase
MHNSLERIIPELTGADEVDQQTLQLHLQRYHYAGRHLIPGTIADIACGTGYGSFLLATDYNKYISRIYAVDNEPFCITYAAKHYAHPLITYVNSDAYQFEPAESLTNIISLETMEHLDNPTRFIQHMAGYLMPKGRFIVSVPITPSMDANPYHLHDFSARTFKEMFLLAGFRELNSFVQKQSYNPFFILKRTGERTKDIRGNILSFYWKNPKKFLARLASLLSDGFNNKYLVVVFEKT